MKKIKTKKITIEKYGELMNKVMVKCNKEGLCIARTLTAMLDEANKYTIKDTSK
jgi:hypothetical protein